MQCDIEALAVLPWPAAEVRPAVSSIAKDDRIGVRAVLNSKFTPDDWYAVLRSPESQEDWQAPAFGVRRVDRLDPDHIYQQMDLTMLFGAVHIREQLVVRIEWMATRGAIANCWNAVDPAPWKAIVPTWDANWETAVNGGWNVDSLPSGGSRVSYQVWADSQTLLPGIQKWAMSRTLPQLLESFEAHVGSFTGGAHAGVGPPGQ